MSQTSPLPLADFPREIRETASLIRPYLRQTPVVAVGRSQVPALEQVSLKLESLQYSGSFKARGAFANLLRRSVPKDGVVAASGGNHGAAVAYAANRLGVPATIFVPTISSPAKIARIKREGAELVVTGDLYADALAASEEWSATRDVMSVHAYDQLETILGQGTAALELEEQLPEIDTVLAAVGGGGLIAGICAWFGRRVRVVGVEPVGAPTLTRALEAGEPVDAEGSGIAADSLAPRRVGNLVFRVVEPIIQTTVLIPDNEIRAAQQRLWDDLRVVAEPGGATAFAAITSGAYVPRAGERVAVMISGANTTAVDFNR
ncbi:MAG TPA: threonine/serine dehydratase [Gemmatimonadaceae bacterium]|jgi:threonine dehydratase